MVSESEPKNIAKAMNSPEANKWKEVLKDELDSLAQMKTWTLVPLPGKPYKTVDCKMGFQKKENMIKMERQTDTKQD